MGLLAGAALLVLLMVTNGCGAPGEPMPPSPPIPVAIMDLTAHQAGDGVMLEFTVPGKSVRGEKLEDVPTIEILRGLMGTDGTPDAKSFRVADSVPGAVLATYIEKGKAHFLDPVTPDEIRAHAGATVVYRVRARVTDKKTSANSNDATLIWYAVAEPIDTLSAKLTENGINLRWDVPQSASGGEPITGIAEYHLYRGEVDPHAAEATAKELFHTTWKSPLLRIAATKTPEYRDAAFDYGKTYVYIVRSVLAGDAAGVESSDSRAAIITPMDTYPPAAPQGIVAAVLGGAEAGQFVVDLSWSINVEADLAGYRVYRSEQQGALGEALNAEFVATPAYRDGTVASGRKYWYSVKAVDRAGNESAASEQIGAEVETAQ
jgi:hypothetical protein